jgi:predicted O-methyltransferase YrrM
MSEWNQSSIQALSRAFQESRIFLTGAELDLFDLLAARPLSAGEVAAQTGANLRGLTILLDALAAMGLLVKEEGRYQCEPSAAPFLTADSPASLLPTALHAADLWHRWSKLTEIVAGAQAGQRSSAAIQRAFIGAMNASAAAQADRIVALVAPGPARKLLDVGGASGTYTMAFLRAVPEMRATLFDRPAVVEMARERLEAAGVLDRVALVPGDFYQDPLPPGHDLAFVSAIIHQNSPQQNVELFRKVLAALDPGGRIVVRDYVLSPDRTSPRPGAIFAVNMLTGGASGNCYTYEEIKDALVRAGFTRVNLGQPATQMDGLVEAFKPYANQA